jgi:hypothetical protein
MSGADLEARALIVQHFAPEAMSSAFSTNGAAVFGPPALSTAWHKALVEEARTQSANASWHLTGERSSGEIAQSNRRGFLGPLARDFMAAHETVGLLRAITGRNLVPSWSASCYTYYDNSGHFLGEHCDKFDACRVALLVYLDARWGCGEAPSAGLMLHVFAGDSSDTPLSLRITSLPNRIVILNGTQHAHLRPKLGPGESLTMLAACYTEIDHAMG